MLALDGMRRGVTASIVVFLVAMPLCVGIAVELVGRHVGQDRRAGLVKRTWQHFVMVGQSRGIACGVSGLGSGRSPPHPLPLLPW
jgi:MFS superfamily sulfate permease-like transporter